MASGNGRSTTQVLGDLEQERQHLVASLAQLRGEIGHATDLTALIRARLPVAIAAAYVGGFVLGGGVGATIRYFARRGR